MDIILAFSLWQSSIHMNLGRVLVRFSRGNLTGISRELEHVEDNQDLCSTYIMPSHISSPRLGDSRFSDKQYESALEDRAFSMSLPILQ